MDDVVLKKSICNVSDSHDLWLWWWRFYICFQLQYWTAVCNMAPPQCLVQSGCQRGKGSVLLESVSFSPASSCTQLPRSKMPSATGNRQMLLLLLAIKAKAYSSYIAPPATHCSCSGAFVSETEWAYSLDAMQFKPALTNFDLQPNSHTQPWSAVWWSPPQ